MSITSPAYGLVAALFTRMSMAPRRSTHAEIAASASSGLPALAANHSLPGTVAAASWSASSRRAVSITRAPSSVNARAIERPMPREAPVTRATFPSSFTRRTA